MSLVKRNNLMLPNLMNEFFAPDWFGGMETYKNVPAVNIIENDKDFALELALPGFVKDDFNVEVDNDVLTISSTVEKETEAKEDNYTRREFRKTSFKRAFTLPETVNTDSINATYENGILRLTLPKKQESLPKPKRLIQIG